MPGMIGPDPALQATEGYHGLAANVPDASQDSQSPFDNMAWQMFVALNWAPTIRAPIPELRSGVIKQECGLAGAGPRMSLAASPVSVTIRTSLPRVGLMTKSDGQPDDRMSEFPGGLHHLPLIVVAGNWAVFERRISPREVEFLKSNSSPPGRPGRLFQEP